MNSNSFAQKRHRERIRAVREGEWSDYSSHVPTVEKTTGVLWFVISETPDCKYFKLRRKYATCGREYVKTRIVSERVLVLNYSADIRSR